jgi:putative spermidine/putrescine transport system permease protein
MKRYDKNGSIAFIFNGVFLAFILAPLIVVCLVSFTDKGYLSLPRDGLSLRWFRAILDHPEFIDAFLYSIYLALGSATLAVILAIPAAMATARYRFPGRGFIMAFFMAPLMIPHVVLGVAFLSYLSRLGWAGTYIGLVACHVIMIMPYALRLVLASVTGMDRSAESAARSLGASKWVTFRRVTIPLIMPGVTGGWVLAFITSFDELTMTLFIASPSSTTLPVRMYQHITETIDPLIASVSAVIIFITMIMMLILDRIFGLDKLLVGK